MENFVSKVISRALQGLIILVPLAIIFVAVMEIYGLLEDTAAFAALDFPFPAIVNGLIFIALGAAATFLVCLTVGLLLATGPGQRFGQFVQKGIAERIPLLGLVRNLTMSLTGTGNSQLKAVEVNLYGDGACQFGFLIETLADTRHVVFIPGAPAATLGQTYIVPPERVKLLDAALPSVVNCITQWGTGAGELYK
jgi:uncharacterized membrane protein